MKSLGLLVILLIVSCGNSRKTTIRTRRSQSTGNIVLKASRTYVPNSWSAANHTATVTNDYTMPSIIYVTNDIGNAGTGWTSITIKNRKFCYQGDAANDEQTSDKFYLIKEKNNILGNCNEAAGDITFVRAVTINQGDQIKMELHGGGCSLISNPITCQNTEVKATIAL